MAYVTQVSNRTRYDGTLYQRIVTAHKAKAVQNYVTPPPSATSVTRSATAATKASRRKSMLSTAHRPIRAGNETNRSILGG